MNLMGFKGKDPINFNWYKHDEAGEKSDEGEICYRSITCPASAGRPLAIYHCPLTHSIVSKPDSFCIGSELPRMLIST